MYVLCSGSAVRCEERHFHCVPTDAHTLNLERKPSSWINDAWISVTMWQTVSDNVLSSLKDL